MERYITFCNYTILGETCITFFFIYNAMFIENGKLDSTDKLVMVGSLFVMGSVIIISGIDITSDGANHLSNGN